MAIADCFLIRENGDGLEKAGMVRNLQQNMRRFRYAIPLLLTYQVFSKLLIALVLVPAFQMMTSLLLRQTGNVGITDATLLPFLMTPQGVLFLVVGALVFLLIIVVDFSGFILISRDYLVVGDSPRRFRPKKLVKNLAITVREAFQSFFRLIEPHGILLFLYFGFIVPLTGMGISASVLKNLKVPNFIMSVVLGDKRYLAIFLLVVIVCVVLGLQWIFVMHFIVLRKRKVKEALSASAKMVRKNWKGLLKHFLYQSLLIGLVLLGVATLFLMLAGASFEALKANVIASRTLMIFFLLVFSVISYLSVLLFIPLEFFFLTDLFYRYEERAEGAPALEEYAPVFHDPVLHEQRESKKRRHRSFLLRVFSATFAIVILLISIPLAVFFEELFRPERDIAIVAHRAGGDLAAENSLEGVLSAAEHGAKWSELDVQRTMDDRYIIHHDADLKRLTGMDRSSQEMTLEEVEALTVKNYFPSGSRESKIATLEQVLDASKDRIGLFLELKGKTADHRMADDVVRMLRERDRMKDCVIMTLDYSMVQYLKEHHPDVQVGYLYFFTFGRSEELLGDYMVLEEEVATDIRLFLAKLENKKVGVWTVNTEESMRKFVNKDVDFIITDHVERLKRALEEENKKTDYEIMMDTVLPSI